MFEVLDMGRYALYVWGSFGCAALFMIAEPILLIQRRKKVEKRIARMIRMSEES